jgi:hypothetical protein
MSRLIENPKLKFFDIYFLLISVFILDLIVVALICTYK